MRWFVKLLLVLFVVSFVFFVVKVVFDSWFYRLTHPLGVFVFG
jgi:hypothetical protein